MFSYNIRAKYVLPKHYAYAIDYMYNCNPIIGFWGKGGEGYQYLSSPPPPKKKKKKSKGAWGSAFESRVEPKLLYSFFNGIVVHGNM